MKKISLRMAVKMWGAQVTKLDWNPGSNKDLIVSAELGRNGLIRKTQAPK